MTKLRNNTPPLVQQWSNPKRHRLTEEVQSVTSLCMTAVSADVTFFCSHCCFDIILPAAARTRRQPAPAAQLQPVPTV